MPARPSSRTPTPVRSSSSYSARPSSSPARPSSRQPSLRPSSRTPSPVRSAPAPSASAGGFSDPAAYNPPASNTGAGGLSAEQQAFLERKRQGLR